jgi:hypothetical protein
LEDAARQALVAGQPHFALNSGRMAQAIRINADELARDEPSNAKLVLQQATKTLAGFNAAHPHRMLTAPIH